MSDIEYDEQVKTKSRKKLKWESKYSGSKMIETTIDWYKVFINKPDKIEQFSKKQILDYFSGS